MPVKKILLTINDDVSDEEIDASIEFFESIDCVKSVEIIKDDCCGKCNTNKG